MTGLAPLLNTDEKVSLITFHKGAASVYRRKAEEYPGGGRLILIDGKRPSDLLDELEGLLQKPALRVIGLHVGILTDLRRWIALAYLAKRRGKQLVILAEGCQSPLEQGTAVDPYTWQNAMLEQEVHLVDDFTALVELSLALALLGEQPFKSGEMVLLNIGDDEDSWKALRNSSKELGENPRPQWVLVQFDGRIFDRNLAKELVRLQASLAISFLVHAESISAEGEGVLREGRVLRLTHPRLVQRLLGIFAAEQTRGQGEAHPLQEWGFTCLPGFQKQWFNKR